MIDTTEKPKILSSREARYNNKFACYISRNNELVAYTDRESLVLYDSNVLELYSSDEGPSRTTITDRGTSSKATATVGWPNFFSSSSFIHNLGSQLSGLPKTILQKAKAIFPRSRPILFRFLWLQPRTLVVLTVRLDLS